MLVLGRKEQESIEINVHGEKITLHIVSVQGKRVKVGIEADKSVHVVRSEIKGEGQ
jgi:carbon storage regulator CsrA